MKCNSMRALALAIPVVIASCAGSESINSPPVSVHGIVLDSVLSIPIANAAISIAGRSTRTDSTGAFSIADVPAGNQTVIVVATGFEPFLRKLSFTSNGQHDIPLRRVRPFIKDFSITSTKVSATLVDLQGVGSLNLDFSYVTIPYVGGVQPRPLTLVPRPVIDPFSVTLGVGGTWVDVTEATWVVRDLDGNVGQFICTRQSCTEIFSF